MRAAGGRRAPAGGLDSCPAPAGGTSRRTQGVRACHASSLLLALGIARFCLLAATPAWIRPCHLLSTTTRPCCSALTAGAGSASGNSAPGGGTAECIPAQGSRYCSRLNIIFPLLTYTSSDIR